MQTVTADQAIADAARDDVVEISHPVAAVGGRRQSHTAAKVTPQWDAAATTGVQKDGGSG